MIRLDDKGITEAVNRVYPSRTGTYRVSAADRAIRDTQLKKMVEWGNEECVEHPTCETTVLLRRECDACWQALYEEIK